MPLQSKLFAGDLELEAAAVDDSAHIMQGARGDHVSKIQVALQTIDDANIDVDGVYGPQTSAAVLSFKRKRRIVNTHYQTQPDSIVGKMTIAALDSEMVKSQNKKQPIETSTDYCKLTRNRHHPRLSFNFTSNRSVG